MKNSTSRLKSIQLRHSLWLRKRTPKKGTPRKTPNKHTPRKSTPRKSNTPRKQQQRTPRKSVEDVAGPLNSAKKIFIKEAYETAVLENGKRIRLNVDALHDSSHSGKVIPNCSNALEISESHKRVRCILIILIR